MMDMQEPAVVRWAMAVSAVPYTEEVGQSVIEVTLQVASFQPFRGLIPVGVWAWFKERPSLPPERQGRLGTNPHVIDYVRTLGDLEILKSYFLVLWSEWGFLSDNVLHAMESSLREDFCRTEMGQHREDLMQRLDHVLGELGRGLEYFTRYTTRYSDEDKIQASKNRYGKLKDVLLEVEREAAMKTSTRMSQVDPLQRVSRSLWTLYRVLLNLCSATLVPVISHLERLVLLSNVSAP